ncbi:hypothetical protein ANCCAN_07445 [Ancylostoma caninum]|uniref:Protein kinase domain-containing protein n=1 Tax=Ancylostoma caninum TaxID=29170 RepID=A0A368GUA6_ANCCA|nr:hypothetical protein ANCCAN_07445 [Ancylostoma caninum]
MCCVALKCINLRKFQNNTEALNQCKKEAYLQRLLSTKVCDNMIRYIGMRVETECRLNELQIYFEYADGGELFDQIGPDVGMPPVSTQWYFRQLLICLRHIHSMGVVHRDIKPENLLLTTQDKFLLTPIEANTECCEDGPAYKEWVTGTMVFTGANPWNKIDNNALYHVRECSILVKGSIGNGDGPSGDIKKKAPDASSPTELDSLGKSGKLAEDTNMFRGLLTEYNESTEAKKPTLRWGCIISKVTNRFPYFTSDSLYI